MNNSGKNSKEKLRRNKFLRNKKSFIFLLILCLGVGFAFLSSQLTITGNTSVSGNKWSVYFTNVQVTDGSVDATVEPTTTGTTTTSLEYTVLLDKPGDFYEFTVDAVNNGTIDAMIESTATPNIDSRVLQYVSYSATYEDGTELAQNDVLKKNSTSTYKVRVEFKKDIEATDLNEDDINLTLTFGVNYVQSNIKPKEFIELVKDRALLDTSINFGAISSETNGRGLYVMNSTAEDTYPIYYYRGAVTNNNAKFAGFCWRIVRTTETGGTKLLYNGLPDEDGNCTNTTGEATQLSKKSTFSTNSNSPAYNGYMYGTVYAYKEDKTASSDYSYGTNFEFVDADENVSGDGTYTLTNTTTNTSDINTHHYTCFNSSGTCSELYYIYYMTRGLKAFYISLKDGKGIDDALVEMKVNTTNSNVKTTVDDWFDKTFKTYFTSNNKDYNDYLEDTVWCNDRSMNTIDVDGTGKYTNNGWKSNGGSTSNYLWYSAYGRIKTATPSLACSNKNDSFTVTESATGNGALTYPVGLLTADEMVLAGGQLGEVATANTDYYLNTDQTWWSMTPYDFGWGSMRNPRWFTVYSFFQYIGRLDGYDDYVSLGVRPSISLKSGVKVAVGGKGTSTAPYEFVVD